MGLGARTGCAPGVTPVTCVPSQRWTADRGDSMPETAAQVRIRPVTELDLDSIVRIDERITGDYRPDVWERRVMYYLRRDPDASQAAEVGGKVVGFMLGEVRSGEFGIEVPGGWVERFGIHPDHRGRD